MLSDFASPMENIHVRSSRGTCKSDSVVSSPKLLQMCLRIPRIAFAVQVLGTYLRLLHIDQLVPLQETQHPACPCPSCPHELCGTALEGLHEPAHQGLVHITALPSSLRYLLVVTCTPGSNSLSAKGTSTSALRNLPVRVGRAHGLYVGLACRSFARAGTVNSCRTV